MYCSVNPAIRRRLADRRSRSAGSSSSGEGWRDWRPRGRLRCGATSVVLFERRPVLGGRARLAGPAVRARSMGAIHRLAARRVGGGRRRHPVGVDADAAAVLAEKPDAVIFSTGSVSGQRRDCRARYLSSTSTSCSMAALALSRRPAPRSSSTTTATNSRRRQPKPWSLPVSTSRSRRPTSRSAISSMPRSRRSCCRSWRATAFA